MAVTSGFFNSVNGDRKYNAEQMSAIFDGIINDGVFANIGTAFAVKSSEGNTVNVGIGRAWFKSTWIYNDAILPVKLDDAELVLDRIDAIVIDVDRTNEVRDGTIKVVKGTPSSSPQNPEMADTDYIQQIPLAFILRKAGSTTITQANITNMVGTSSCPYVTGILQVQNIDNIVAQWQAQWIEWFAYETADTEEQANKIISDWTQWYADQTDQNEAQMTQWMAQMQSDFNVWLQSLKDAIGDDAAATLASEIVELQNKFDTLMRDQCIYDAIEDSTGQGITDSDGLAIEGKTVFGVEGNPGTNTEVPIDNTRLISTYVHVKVGTVHNFYGRGENGRAKITDDFAAGDTFAVNDVPVSAYVGADSPDGDTIVKGRWVAFIFDGNEINFRSGGGLTNSKLAQATADADDVLSGETFYSKDKNLKTGTLVLSGNATAADVLSGKTFYSTNPKSKQTGTRPAGKLVYNLGTGTSFTVTSYSGYKNFTTSNFIVGLKQVNNGRVDFPDHNDSATTFAGVKFSLSYSASTGKLTVKPLPVYSPGSSYKAGTIACWNGNETGGIKDIKTVGYTFFAYLVVNI